MEDLFKILNKQLKQQETMFNKALKDIEPKYRKVLSGYMMDLKQALRDGDSDKVYEIQEKINIFTTKVKRDG